MALVIDGPTTVCARGAVRRSDLARLRKELLRGRLAPQQLLRSREMDRRQPNGAERDADVGNRAAIDPHGSRGGGDGPVASPSLDLLVCAAGARPNRKADLGK